jgi:hypothetical protein
MLAVLITLTPGRRNKFISCRKAKLRIAVLPIVDVKKRCKSTLELLEHAYPLCEYPCKALKNPQFSDYWPLFPKQDMRTIVRYVMEVLQPFWY